MITIDGSQGEGGGQILRTSLALSLVTGQPFRMERIRARRQKPGLLKQHLTAVEASKMVGCAEVTGAALGSQTLEFTPGLVTPGNYRFAVGTAGSATLVLQTVLPVLLTASGLSTLTLEGGTHNPMAPPFDFLEKSFMPLIHRMGPSVELELRRPGFYPAGGGRFHARIEPVKKLSRLDLLERGAIRARHAKALISKLPEHVAERELSVLREELRWRPEEYGVDTVPHPIGPGNAVVLSVEAERVGAVTFFGATLWTDFTLNGNPVVSEVVAQTGMNDYRRIRTLPNYKRLRPSDTCQFHAQSRKWLEDELPGPMRRKVVVVTHHAPSPESIPAAFEGDDFNPAFASDSEAVGGVVCHLDPPTSALQLKHCHSWVT